MRIILPSFNIAIEIIEFFQIYQNERDISYEEVISALGKTPHYVKSTIKFLVEVEVLNSINSNKFLLGLNPKYSKFLKNGGSEVGVLKLSLTHNKVYKEYQRLLNKGKTENQSAKYVIASNNLINPPQDLIKVFHAWANFLKSDDKKFSSKENLQVKNDTYSFMWINVNGELEYDESSHAEFIKSQFKQDKKNLGEGSVFVDPLRIEQLKQINSDNFDLSKLIRKCEELNIVYSTQSYYSVGMLIRAIIDHVSPIFSKRMFSEVAGSHGTRSFRDSMMHLDKSSRKIADSYLHTQIRRKEVLPTKTQVNFSRDLDVLLSEIVRILK